MQPAPPLLHLGRRQRRAGQHLDCEGPAGADGQVPDGAAADAAAVAVLPGQRPGRVAERVRAPRVHDQPAAGEDAAEHRSPRLQPGHEEVAGGARRAGRGRGRGGVHVHLVLQLLRRQRVRPPAGARQQLPPQAARRLDQRADRAAVGPLRGVPRLPAVRARVQKLVPPRVPHGLGGHGGGDGHGVPGRGRHQLGGALPQRRAALPLHVPRRAAAARAAVGPAGGVVHAKGGGRHGGGGQGEAGARGVLRPERAGEEQVPPGGGAPRAPLVRGGRVRRCLLPPARDLLRGALRHALHL